MFLFLFLFFCVVIPCFAAEQLLHSYSSNGIYYYYIPDFNPEKYTKPIEVKYQDRYYTMFVYSKPISADKLKNFKGNPINNETGFLFPMILTGIENKPDYYVFASLDQFNNEDIKICKLNNTTYDQTMYTNKTETGEFIKQMTFNNGEFNVGSICYPDYVPGGDI